MPSEWFGIDNLTVIQQRVIAIFAFATLMWILEIVSSWATSVAIIVLMLLFCSDSGIAPMVNEEEVGKLLSYKGVMASFADPVIMLFIGGFVLAIAATKTGLDAQLAKVLLKPFGTRSEMVLLGFLDDAWYTLDGRRLIGRPTQRGVYVNNHKKVVIKVGSN